MGLDMYLHGRRYLSSYRDDEKEIAEDISKHFEELKDSNLVPNEIQVEVGYWRKANAIHKWFVKNVQDGVDNCSSYSVSRQSLTELKELCERVLGFRHLANELLPTSTGFFFGNTDYDDMYYQDLKETIDILERTLKMPDTWEFEYRASW